MSGKAWPFRFAHHPYSKTAYDTPERGGASEFFGFASEGHSPSAHHGGKAALMKPVRLFENQSKRPAFNSGEIAIFFMVPSINKA